MKYIWEYWKNCIKNFKINGKLQKISRKDLCKNNKELLNADTKYSKELKRFYIKKKYIRKRK